MTLHQHATSGVLGGTLILPWSFDGAITFALASVIIDIDHFLFIWFQTGMRPSFNPAKAIRSYKKWDYYGPRVLIFHNYETVLLLVLLMMSFGGIFGYLFAGIALHLIMDQLESYSISRYIRIRTLVGDCFRYYNYLLMRRQGRENEYLVARRDSWWNHLRSCFPKNQHNQLHQNFGILKTFPEKPFNLEEDVSTWRRIL